MEQSSGWERRTETDGAEEWEWGRARRRARNKSCGSGRAEFQIWEILPGFWGEWHNWQIFLNVVQDLNYDKGIESMAYVTVTEIE
jgi:hypothetical protein